MSKSELIYENFISILKNDDIQKYKGNAFENFIQAIFTGDVLSGLSTIRNIKDLIFHIPTARFWDKMQKFLLGTYRSFEEQVKMSSKFNNDNEKFKKYICELIDTIDKIDTDLKIQYYSNLVRAFLLEIIDDNLFYKLHQVLMNCTIKELEYIDSNNENKHFEYNIMIFSLKNMGLIEQTTQNNFTYYIFSDLGKSLKIYALNDDENFKPKVNYLSLSAPTDTVPVIQNDIDNLF